MKYNLELITKIYKLKNFINIRLSNKFLSFKIENLLTNDKLFTDTNGFVFFIKDDIIMFSRVHYINNIMFKSCLISYFKLSVELATLFNYRDFFLRKVYTNYDLSMIYYLSMFDANTESIFDLDSNSIINIRKPLKVGNSTLVRRTGLIDAILKKYIESILDAKVSINFDKYNLCFVKKKSIFFRILRRRMQRINRLLRNSDLSLRTFIRVTFIFMCTKDLDLFSKVLLKLMNHMHYKNHRRFLYYLKLFITKSMNFYFEILKFEGFFFYLSGKISGGGNSKKKYYVVKHGKYSLTNKMLKLKFKKGLIYTKTGVMGYRFMVSYK
jgi:hypothetical protein